jgi:hypothetical protein
MHLPCEGQKQKPPADQNAEQVGCCSCTQAQRLMARVLGRTTSASQLALEVKIGSFQWMEPLPRRTWAFRLPSAPGHWTPSPADGELIVAVVD